MVSFLQFLFELFQNIFLVVLFIEVKLGITGDLEAETGMDRKPAEDTFQVVTDNIIEKNNMLDIIIRFQRIESWQFARRYIHHRMMKKIIAFFFQQHQHVQLIAFREKHTVQFFLYKYWLNKCQYPGKEDLAHLRGKRFRDGLVII